MKKRNIVRFTALLMAVLICLSTGLTLFAEGVDSTEATTEAEPQTVSDNDTEAKTVSDNDATTSTRSEIGQKILDFKNPEEYKNKQVFSGDIYKDGNINTSGSVLWYIFNNDVKIGIYNKIDDSIKYCGTLNTTPSNVEDQSSIDNSHFYKDSIADASIKSLSDSYIGLDPNSMYRYSVSIPDVYKDLYICLIDKSVTENDLVADNLLFVSSIEDSVNYVKDSQSVFDTIPYEERSTASVKCTPIVDDDDSINRVTVTINFNIVDFFDYSSEDFDFYFDNKPDLERTNKATCIKIKKGDNVVGRYNITEDNKGGLKTGSHDFIVNSGNGTYTYEIETLLSGIFMKSTNIKGQFNITDFRSGKEEPIISDDDLKAATVSFSGMPNEAYTNDSVTLKMNTDKKCKMSFNGSSLANDEYTTSADFTVTSNGTYSYTATNEQGVATNGTFEVTFFKDKIDDAIKDPLQTDLVSAKTDSNLSQTGLYQTWLIILAVILCSFGILLIVNQKYHFLDKFIRRFKHESN